MKQFKAELISNREVMPGAFLVWIESPQIAATVRPGQFVMVGCGENTLLRRPFSIHQVNNNKTSLALLFSIVGKGTRWLSLCKTGDRIDLLGPLGNGFSINSTARNLLLVGGGIGIAPLPFLARTALENECDVTILMGATTVTQLCLESLLPQRVDLIIATDDGTAGIKGFITDVICEHTSRDQTFACGPTPMYRTMAEMPELKGKSVQVSLEVRMGCGFGLCYGCTVKTKAGLKQVCKDGPIFKLDDILWDEFVDI